MNPQFHEHFMTLCALFYSDELSMEEWALLQVHMAYCEECEQRFQEYKKLAKEVIPVMAAAAVANTAPHETPEEFRAAERRLMHHLHDISQTPKPVPQKPFAFRGWGVGFAAGILVCAALAGIYIPRSKLDFRHPSCQ